jgi:hypothetical protein
MQNYQISLSDDGETYMISSRGHVLKLRASDRAILDYDADYATAIAMRDAVAGKLDWMGLPAGCTAEVLSHDAFPVI